MFSSLTASILLVSSEIVSDVFERDPSPKKNVQMPIKLYTIKSTLKLEHFLHKQVFGLLFFKAELAFRHLCDRAKQLPTSQTRQ